MKASVRFFRIFATAGLLLTSGSFAQASELTATDLTATDLTATDWDGEYLCVATTLENGKHKYENTASNSGFMISQSQIGTVAFKYIDDNYYYYNYSAEPVPGPRVVIEAILESSLIKLTEEEKAEYRRAFGLEYSATRTEEQIKLNARVFCDETMFTPEEFRTAKVTCDDKPAKSEGHTLTYYAPNVLSYAQTIDGMDIIEYLRKQYGDDSGEGENEIPPYQNFCFRLGEDGRPLNNVEQIIPDWFFGD